MDMTFDLPVTSGKRSKRGHQRKSRIFKRQSVRFRERQFSSFECAHCHNYVATEAFISGVQNRNHCPCCLWSKHVDLYGAGDRLAACKGDMRPVGLTLKATRNKYAGYADGELMLIHQCAECGALSINRIAADDLPDNILLAFSASLELGAQLAARLNQDGIRALTARDGDMVRSRLFGWQGVARECLN